MEDHDNMKSKRHTPEQVIRKVAEGDEMLNKGASAARWQRATRSAAVV